MNVNTGISLSTSRHFLVRFTEVADNNNNLTIFLGKCLRSFDRPGVKIKIFKMEYFRSGLKSVLGAPPPGTQPTGAETVSSV